MLEEGADLRPVNNYRSLMRRCPAALALAAKSRRDLKWCQTATRAVPGSVSLAIRALPGRWNLSRYHQKTTSLGDRCRATLARFFGAYRWSGENLVPDLVPSSADSAVPQGGSEPEIPLPQPTALHPDRLESGLGLEDDLPVRHATSPVE